jgi:phage terminase small subunit
MGAMGKEEDKINNLSDKQARFAAEYLIDLNATQAAVRAGYSEKTAESQGCRMLKNVKVAAVIQENMNKRAARIEITADKVLQEIAKLSFANLQDFYNENGSLKEIHSLPRDVAAALSSTKINLTEACAVQEIKLHDKKGSLELLGRHLKLFTDKTELTGEGGGPVQTITRIELVPLGDDPS